MEDFDQTQLLHTESYLTTRLQSTAEIEDEDEYTMHLLDENGTLTTDDDYFEASFPSPYYHSARIHPTVGIPASFYPNARNGDNVLGFPVSLYPNARNGQVSVSLFSDYVGDDEVEEAIMYESISEFIDDDYYPAPDSVRLDDIREEQSALHIVRSPQTPNDGRLLARSKTISCLAHLITLWSIVFLTMAFGVRETGDIRSGLGLSLLLKANRLFVETIQVEQPSDSKVGPILYGFDSQPLLNVTTSWSEAQYASLQANMHKEWIYFLNKGSEINISYSVPSSSKLLLTINEGSDGYDYRYGLGYCYGHGQCLYDQSSRDITLSWNIIHGKGRLTQNISRSGKYHIAVENLNSDTKEVQLKISVRTLIYDTNAAYYICKLAQHHCVFPLSFLEENHAVLTTPQLKQGSSNGEWYLKLSYGPRWTTFLGGIVVIIGMALLGIALWDKHGGIIS